MVCVFTQTLNVVIMLFTYSFDRCINWITSFLPFFFIFIVIFSFVCVKSSNIPSEEGANCNTTPSYCFVCILLKNVVNVSNPPHMKIIKRGFVSPPVYCWKIETVWSIKLFIGWWKCLLKGRDKLYYKMLKGTKHFF